MTEEESQKEFEEYCKNNKGADPLLYLFGFVFSMVFMVVLLSC